MSAAHVASVTSLHVDGLLEPDGGTEIDRPRAEQAVGELLLALGRDIGEDGLRTRRGAWPPPSLSCSRTSPCR
jgi:hypothetical protein